MAVNPILAQQLRKGIVERFKRTPRTVHEIEASGMHVAARRHAGQRTGIMPVENH